MGHEGCSGGEVGNRTKRDKESNAQRVAKVQALHGRSEFIGYYGRIDYTPGARRTVPTGCPYSANGLNGHTRMGFC